MRAITMFVALAFGISWAIAWGGYQAGGFAGLGQLGTLGLLVGFMAGPSIAALATALVFDRGRIAQALGFTGIGAGRVIVWVLLAWLIPLILIAASTVATLFILGQQPVDMVAFLTAQIEATGETLPMPIETLLMIQVFVGLPIALVLNTGILLITEELGWRGWLQTRLASLGFWPMCLIIGVLWGAWHAPLILMGHNYPGLGWTGVAAMIAFAVLLTPYHALARERGGVVAAAAMHGSVNAFAGLFILLIADSAWPWNGILGVGGFAVMAAGLLPLWVYRSRVMKADIAAGGTE
jgi:membrane protease YdiL (CAAX protease family)